MPPVWPVRMFRSVLAVRGSSPLPAPPDQTRPSMTKASGGHLNAASVAPASHSRAPVSAFKERSRLSPTTMMNRSCMTTIALPSTFRTSPASGGIAAFHSSFPDVRSRQSSCPSRMAQALPDRAASDSEAGTPSRCHSGRPDSFSNAVKPVLDIARSMPPAQMISVVPSDSSYCRITSPVAASSSQIGPFHVSGAYTLSSSATSNRWTRTGTLSHSYPPPPLLGSHDFSSLRHNCTPLKASRAIKAILSGRRGSTMPIGPSSST